MNFDIKHISLTKTLFGYFFLFLGLSGLIIRDNMKIVIFILLIALCIFTKIIFDIFRSEKR